MPLGLHMPNPPREAAEGLFLTPSFLLLRVTVGLPQGAQQEDRNLPEHDLRAETKIKGAIGEENPLSGNREDFTELTIKNGGDKGNAVGIHEPASECIIKGIR